MTNTARQIRAGLVGTGIGESRSPSLHMEEGRALGLDVRYQLFDLGLMGTSPVALQQVLEETQVAGYSGLNVTHPCKQQVIALLDELSADAAALGAVNTVLFRDGRRLGCNTDWQGFRSGFQLALPDARLQRVLLLGAGGAGSAVAYALLHMGTTHLLIHDVDTERAAWLAQRMAMQFPGRRVTELATLGNSLTGVNGIVNATPIGMAAYPGTPLPAGLLRPDLWVADVVYFPIETELLRQARAAGCRTMDGGNMVVFQAAIALQLFTGLQPDVRRMLQAFAAGYTRRTRAP